MKTVFSALAALLSSTFLFATLKSDYAFGEVGKTTVSSSSPRVDNCLAKRNCDFVVLGSAAIR
jgi:hypothetical protein